MPTPSCLHCAAALSATANFCPDCGARVDRASSPLARQQPHASSPALWRIRPAAVTVVAVLGVAAYVMVSGRGSTPAGPIPAAAADGMGGTASDISTLTVEQRADRLFTRVLAMAAAGHVDSVDFFAPMAVNAFAALEELDEHRRYDLGLVYLVAGQPHLARAQADTIMTTAPRHLLALALAMRAARATGDSSAWTVLAERFLAARGSERQRGLPEYLDHANDLEVASAEAERRSAAVGRGLP